MSCRYFFSTVDISTLDISTVDICNSTASQSSQTFSTLRCNFTRPVSENSESSGWDKMQFHYVTTNLQSGSLCDFAMFCSPLVTLRQSAASLGLPRPGIGLTQPNLAQFELLPTVVSSVGIQLWCIVKLRADNTTPNAISTWMSRGL